MNNRQELDKLVMTDPLAYVVYTKSKIQDQSFEQFLISLVLTQHSRMKDLEEQVIDDEELLINKTGEIVELEKKLEEANEISNARFDRMEELSDVLVEESDKYEEQIAELERKLISENAHIESIRQQLAERDAQLKVCIEALKWYADDNNYDEGTGFWRGVSSVQSNGGWHATEALKQIGAGDV